MHWRGVFGRRKASQRRGAMRVDPTDPPDPPVTDGSMDVRADQTADADAAVSPDESPDESPEESPEEVPDVSPEESLEDSPDEASGDTPGTGLTPAVEIEDILHRLEQLPSAARTTVVSPSSSQTLDRRVLAQADSLQTTVSVQKQAQRMLALAMRMRADSAVQAERILHEAREAAGRLEEECRRQLEQTRVETREWALAERASVEAAVRAIVEAAQRDADAMRAEVLQTSRAEAERTARRDAARAAAQGERDAALVRAQARDLLGRLATAVGETTNTVHVLADLLGSHVDVLRQQHESVEQLADELERHAGAFKAQRSSPDGRPRGPDHTPDRDVGGESDRIGTGQDEPGPNESGQNESGQDETPGRAQNLGRDGGRRPRRPPTGRIYPQRGPEEQD